MLTGRGLLATAAVHSVRGTRLLFRRTVTKQLRVDRSARSDDTKSAVETDVTDGGRVFLLSKHRQEKEHNFSEALLALRAYSLSEIPEIVELSVKVDLTLKKNKVRDAFRGTLIYPHRFGSQRKILLLAEDVSLSEVANSGADILGGPDYIKKLESGTLGLSNFDLCVCTTGIYNEVKPLQRKLRAKMPSPRRGTVVELSDVLQTVLENQQSRQYKSDKKGYVNMPVGKLDFPDEHLLDNMKCLISEMISHRGTLPAASFIQRIVLSTTYGPGFHLITKDYI